MATPAPVDMWIAHPDMITSAIRVLAWAVAALGGSLVGTLLYIWNRTGAKIDSLDGKIDRIASGLEKLALTTSAQIAAIEARCEERHSNHRRATDP